MKFSIGVVISPEKNCRLQLDVSISILGNAGLWEMLLLKQTAGGFPLILDTGVLVRSSVQALVGGTGILGVWGEECVLTDSVGNMHKQGEGGWRRSF